MTNRCRVARSLLFLAAAQLLCGYVLMGGRWAQSAIPVSYYTNTQATVPGWEASVRAGFQHWDDVPNCVMDFTWQGQTNRIATTSDNMNVVSLSPDPAALGSGTLAVTTNWYWSNNTFSEFDMEWNQNQNWSTAGESWKMDVESVAAHEAGHALGLDHTNIYEATLYPSTGAGELFRRSLHADDMAGAQALYPGQDATGFAVSGRVTLDGVGFGGVTVTLGSASAATDVNGAYSFANVANGTYTARAARSGYTFSPTSRSVTVNGADVTVADFAGTSSTAGTRYYTRDHSPNLSIPDSGSTTSTIAIAENLAITEVNAYVLIRHTYVGDLVVSLRSPGGTTVTLHNRTGADGDDIVGWYDTTLSPAQALSAFNGQSSAGTWTLTMADQEAQDVGTLDLWKIEIAGTAQQPAPQPQTWSISGRATSGGNGLAGVTVTLGGAGSGSATTDASGNYTFAGRPDGSYTVTPSLTGWTFTPASRSLTVAGGNVAGQDFAGTQPQAAPSAATPAIGLGSGGGGYVEMVNGASTGFTNLRWNRIGWTAYQDAVGETRVAAGDIDGDGRDELAIGTGTYTTTGGYVQIRDDAVANHALLRWVRLNDSAYNGRNGETWPAFGNIDGDARDELLVGFGTTGGGKCLVFDDASANYVLLRTLNTGWTAYNSAVGEVRPSCGDVDGDGRDEIALGLGTYASSGGYVKVIEDATQGYANIAWVRVPDAAYNAANGETRPALGDVDGDGRAELVVGMGTYTANGGRLFVFDDGGAGFAALETLAVGTAAYNAANGETRPALGNVDADGATELLVGFGTYGSDGGRFVQLDDRATGWGSGVAGRVHWSGYNSANGETWPTFGRFR
ncbi:MAG: proprotein convertase P-domain-containing protein [Planctomycetota bacterium]